MVRSTEENREQWQARYEALAMAIDNPAYIENAERLVRVAIDLAASTGQFIAFDSIWRALREAVADQGMADTYRRLTKKVGG